MTACLSLRKSPLKSTGFQGMGSSLKFWLRNNFPQNSKAKVIWQTTRFFIIANPYPHPRFLNHLGPKKIPQEYGTCNGIKNYFFYHQYTMVFSTKQDLKWGDIPWISRLYTSIRNIMGFFFPSYKFH